MKRNRFIPAVITILILVLNIVPVSADIAPPFQPPGANPGLPEFVETSVEMGFETVMIEVEESSTLYYRDPPFDTVNAHVTALFSMSNKTDVEETLQVLFPLNTINGGGGDKDSSYPEIQDFTVSINDFAVDFNVITDPNPQGSDKPEIKWAEYTIGSVKRLEVFHVS